MKKEFNTIAEVNTWLKKSDNLEVKRVLCCAGKITIVYDQYENEDLLANGSSDINEELREESRSVYDSR